MVPAANIGMSSQCGCIAARTFPLCGLPDRARSTTRSTANETLPVPPAWASRRIWAWAGTASSELAPLINRRRSMSLGYEGLLLGFLGFVGLCGRGGGFFDPL